MASDWIAQAARLHADNKPFALVTVLHALAPTSAKPGDKALVTADGQFFGWIGGGCAQPAVLKTVRQALKTGKAQAIRIAPGQSDPEPRGLSEVLEFGMACHSGGTLELFVDPINLQPDLVVVGDSPVAKALVGLGARLGFRVQVVAQGALPEQFEGAATVFDRDKADEVRANIAEAAFVVVATQGRRDMQGLQAAMAIAPKYLWFVASERKANVLRQNLIAAGQSAAAVQAIIAPAGHPIGAKSPEEIALSVLASVVAARRGHLAVPAGSDANPSHHAAALVSLSDDAP